MQAEEGTSMAKMVVMILLVILLIAAVVGLVYGAYNYFTKGADKLTGQMSSIEMSSLSQYDNQMVPGSTVLTTLKSYADSDLAVFICTTNSQEVTNASSSAYKETEGTGGTKAAAKCANYCVLCENNTSGATSGVLKADAAVSTGSSAKYFAIEVKPASESTKNVAAGNWYVETVHWGQGNSVQRNSNFSVTTDKAASKTYVKQSSDFYANLVYDSSTGDVCGIMFRQMN